MADAKLSDLTALAGSALAATDLFYVVDVSATTSGSKKITAAELLAAWPSVAVFTSTVKVGDVILSGAGTDNFCVNADANAIEAGTAKNTIGGGGAADYGANKIGAASNPEGGGAVFPVGHNVADSGYVAASANDATISGGYDHVNNQLAGTICGGGHNFLKYNADGHSAICGGSYHLIVGGYSFIGGGTSNSVVGDKLYSSVVGGYKNAISGSYSCIPGGSDCVVSGAWAFAFGRRAKVTADGAVQFADKTDADVTNSTENSFAARYAAGYSIDAVASSFRVVSTGATVATFTRTGSCSATIGMGGIVTGDTSDTYLLSTTTNSGIALRVTSSGGSVNTGLVVSALSRVGCGGVTFPREKLHAADAIAVSNASEGDTGRLTRRCARQLVTLSGTSTVTTINVPSGALLLGAQFCVDTAVTDDGGNDTWSAAFSGGSTATLATGAAASKQTKVNTLIVPAVASATTNVTFTPNGGSFTAGQIEVLVYYEELTSMADAA